ncbi:hypothetical protein [Streptomyces sp. NPDC008141]|uniref:hypothetical protein n=1 Tax=Streptomyces sp. NPDC008141 TaxID=3364815 RepID=UPI0036E5DC2F
MSQILALAGSIVIVAAGTGRADQVPFPDGGGASFSDSVHPGEYVSITVKGRPENPHPSGVHVSSPALEEGSVLGDTGRAWGGAAHALPTVEPGTHRVKFTLTYRDVPCWNEEDRDSVCDYDPTVVWGELRVEARKEKAGGWGFARGAVLGAAAATVTTASVMFVRRRVPKSARSS